MLFAAYFLFAVSPCRVSIFAADAACFSDIIYASDDAADTTLIAIDDHAITRC